MANINSEPEDEIRRLIDRLEEISKEQIKITKKLRKLQEKLGVEQRPSQNIRAENPSSPLIRLNEKFRFGHTYFTDISGTAYDHEVFQEKSISYGSLTQK